MPAVYGNILQLIAVIVEDQSTLLDIPPGCISLLSPGSKSRISNSRLDGSGQDLRSRCTWAAFAWTAWGMTTDDGPKSSSRRRVESKSICYYQGLLPPSRPSCFGTAGIFELLQLHTLDEYPSLMMRLSDPVDQPMAMEVFQHGVLKLPRMEHFWVRIGLGSTELRTPLETPVFGHSSGIVFMNVRC